MADPKAPDPAPKRVAVIDASGQFGTVDETDVDKMPKGSRVLTRQEQAQQAEDERYDALPTARKALGVASLAAGAINPLLIGNNPDAPPVAAAFGAGARSGLTAGLSDAVTRKALDYVGGKVAGNKFAQQVDEQSEASPIAHGIGAAAGMVAGAALGGEAGAASKFLPGAGISALGDAVEGGVGAAGRALGYAGETALGRAGMSAAELGARGLVEGAAYGGAEAAGDAVLHDTDNATDKIFAAMGTGALYGGVGGAALGATGSLLKSGAVAGLSRVMRPAAESGEGALMNQASTAMSDGSLLGKSVNAKLSDAANNQAWRSINSSGLSPKRMTEQATRYLPNGTNDVGEVLLRRGILSGDPEAGLLKNAWNAAASGRPADLAPKIESELGAVGAQLGAITTASPARVSVDRILKSFGDVAGPLDSKLGQAPVAAHVRDMAVDMMRVLGVKSGEEAIPIQALLEQRQALDKLVYQEAKALDPNMRVAALREVRSNLEGVIVDELDKASGQVAGSAKAEYQSLKRDYTALSIAKEVAEDSAARMAKNRAVSASDYASAVGAAASGHLLAAPVAAIGHKFLRERGNAAAAVALKQFADRGSLANVVESLNQQIGKASKGLLAKPPGALPAAAAMPATKGLAKTALARVAEFQADPDAFIDKAARQTEALSAHSPEIASAIVARSVAAMQFMASKVPVMPDPDPLDPHPAPKMTGSEEAELGRYQWYVDKPQRFFAEVAHGKVTFEGAEVAQKFAPGAFAELQAQTADQLATMMKSRGTKPPFRQIQYIGILLDFAATPSQRPEHARFLQQNLEPLPDPNPPPMPKGGGAALVGKMQTSSYDRLESGGLGR